ncbi:MAG: fibronectin type III domain-containing protein [Eubacterium sp.]|nr:fibronectin type III domain-containing protein [Eubacterium sp.]
MKVKKFLAVLIGAIAMCAICAVCAGAETYGDYTYSVKSDGTVSISGYNGTDTSLEIPSVLGGKQVSAIGSQAFYRCSSITDITVPDGVKSIGSYAFEYCSKLEWIALPDSLTEIGVYAFMYCNSFKDVYYSGTEEQWKAVTTYPSYDTTLEDANIHFFGDPVTGFELKKAYATSLYLTWDRDYTADGYILEQKVGSSWKEVTKIGDNSVTEYEVTGLNVNTAYSFRICSYNDNEEETVYSDYSYVDTTTTRFVVNGFNLKGRAADAIRVKWEQTYGADGYVLEVQKNGAWKTVSDSLSANTTEYRVDDLNGGTKYSFRIKPYYLDNGKKVYGETSTVSYTTNPTIVSGFKLKARAADALRVQWTKNPTASGYIIEVQSGNDWVRVGKVTNPNTTEFKFTKVNGKTLSAGTVYNIRIKTYKMSGSTALYGNTKTISARTNPSAMKGVTLKARAADALRLTWTRNTSADGYIVEMLVNGVWKRAGKVTGNSNVEFKKSGLAGGTAYSFRVCAYKMSGNTALYGKYTTVSYRTNPTVVKGFKLKNSAKDALRLTWTKNTTADGYIIEQKSGSTWKRVGKISNNSTVEFKKSGLSAGTSYTFRICAYKMSGSTALYGNYTTLTAMTSGSAATSGSTTQTGYSTLKNYILRYGSIDSNGNYYVDYSFNTRDLDTYMTVTYLSSTAEFEVAALSASDTGATFTTITFSNSSYIDIISMSLVDNFHSIADATVKKSALTEDTTVYFDVTYRSSNLISASKVSSLTNSHMHLSLRIFKLFLLERTGLSINNLGFTSYN